MSISGIFEKNLGIGREGTWGVVGTVHEWIPFTEEKFDLEIPYTNINQTWAKRDLQKTYQQTRVINSSFGFDVEPENGIGNLLKSLLGTSNSVRFGTFNSYKHTFDCTDAVNLPSLFARIQQYGTFTKDYTGLRINTLELSWNKDENIKCSVEMIGQNELSGTSTVGTYGTIQPFTQFGNTQVWIDGTVNTDIQNVSLQINNNLSPHQLTGTAKTIGQLTAGMREVTGEMLIFFNGETERNKFINKTVSTLQIKAQQGTFTLSGTAKYELNVLLPNIEYTAFPFDKEDGVLAATVPYKALYHAGNSVGTNSIAVELINSIASYL